MSSLPHPVVRMPVVLAWALTLVTFLVWAVWIGRSWQDSLTIAVAVLIITFPCALGLAVSAVRMIARNRLFRHGLLLKSVDAVERLAAVDTIMFDKTGTLTAGHPKLANPSQIGSRNMQLAVSLARHGRHPLAQALVAMYGGKPVPLEVTEHSGKGLEARYEDKILRLGRRDWCGDSEAPADERPELWLQVGDEPSVRFIFADEVRSDAKAVIYELKCQGFAVWLLSSDRQQAVAHVAEALGIADFRAQASLQDKRAIIENLRQSGRCILMVGDGINDAEALSVADVSMSRSTALDVSQNAADIVFQGERLEPILLALTVSKRARHLEKENFVLSLVYCCVAVPLAMMGLVTPLIGAVAMAGASVAVVLNAQRLNRGEPLDQGFKTIK